MFLDILLGCIHDAFTLRYKILTKKCRRNPDIAPYHRIALHIHETIVTPRIQFEFQYSFHFGELP